MERLWTPWRMSYVGGERATEGNIFETMLAEENDEANLILLRGEWCFVILNLFPYNSGHLMIVPYRKVADPADLTPDEWRELTDLLARMTTLLRAVLRPEGFNIGINVGKAAGAGIPDHLHLHIVPRWTGDTNFMPVVGATKVLPELLPETYARLRRALGLTAGGEAGKRESGEAVEAAKPAAAMAAIVAEETAAASASAAATSAREADSGTAEHGAIAAETGSPVAEAAPAAPAANVFQDEAPPPSEAGEITAGAPETPAEPVAPPVPQAGAVVLLRDKVVLRQAKDGSWVLPKGHIEAGETPEQTAAREVAEEMGLTGALGPLVGELRFVQAGRERQVAYYLLRADRRLPSWDDHVGRDTFLFNPREALARLTHPDARTLLTRALELARVK